MLKDCYPIGILKKPHGVKGEVIILFNSNSAEEYKRLESVFIEIDKHPVPFFISEYFVKSDNTAIVKFEEIDKENRIKEFIGCNLLIEKNKLANTSNTKKHKLISYQLFDSYNKYIGEIKDVIDYSGHNVFQIFQNKKEILIPANEDLIVKIDNKKKVVVIQIPDGLLEIYL